MTSTRPRIVVIGGGFGGLWLVRALGHAAVDVTLVDRANHHTFQPLLYQVATAGLEPADIAHSLRGAVRRLGNVRVVCAEVAGLDRAARAVVTADGERIAYDHLVVAAGAVTADYGVPGVAQHAFGLKTLADATALRTHLLQQFEAADRGALDRESALSVVVVGGGPTGVEMAGAVRELIDKVLAADFPHLDVAAAGVTLVEATEAVLGPFHPRLRERAAGALSRRGVALRLGRSVARVGPDAVELDDGTRLPSRTVVWAAGVRANPLAAAMGLPLAAGGRVRVGPDLAVEGEERIWAIGDIAACPDADGRPLPQLAPVAMQQGEHVARQLLADLAGSPTQPFRYRDKGTMATIGRHAAVAQLPVPGAPRLPALRVTGTAGWVLWLGLHLVLLIGFRNRLSVLLNWAWSYLTWDRAARLILPAAPERPAGDGPDATSAVEAAALERTIAGADERPGGGGAAGAGILRGRDDAAA